MQPEKFHGSFICRSRGEVSNVRELARVRTETQALVLMVLTGVRNYMVSVKLISLPEQFSTSVELR